MEKRIELEMRGRKPEEITELNLDNCRATSLAGLTDEFVNLEILSLINVGLTSLKGFPNLPSLRKLELSDNRISNGLEALQGCKQLSYLNLSVNKIKDIESLHPLTELSELKSLDLFNCDIASVEDYRNSAFTAIPNLKFLDGFDVNDREAEDSDEDDADGEVVDPEDGDVDPDDDDDEIVEGDDDDDDDDEDVEDDEEDDEVGLEYLNSSKALEDEDETEDFEGGEDDEEDDEDDDIDGPETTLEESALLNGSFSTTGKAGEGSSSSSAQATSRKRKHSEGDTEDSNDHVPPPTSAEGENGDS